MIIEIAARQPKALAVYAWDGELTYGELDALSTRLAHHIVGYGVGPGSVVPLCFEKSMWAVVAMIAVMKAGGVFIPLDSSHPASRRQAILEEADADMVIVTPETESYCRATTTVVLSGQLLSEMSTPSSTPRSFRPMAHVARLVVERLG